MKLAGAVSTMGMEGFANRLRRAFRAFEDRLGRDVTQTELGELVGQAMGKDAITQQSVGRWFAGTLPDHPHVVALATVLGVDPGWLSYGSGEDNGGGSIAKPPVAPTPELPRTPWRETHREILPPIQRTAPTKKRRPKDDRTARAS